MTRTGLWLALLLWWGSAATAIAADTVRVCAYNVLRYTADNEDGRLPQFKMILDSIQPDLLVCVEVADATMGPRFVTDVLTWAPFAASPYIDGPDMNAQLFYDQEQFDLVGQRRIPTSLRDIAEFTLTTRPDAGFEKDTVVVYGVHLKASSSSSDAQRRAEEVAAMMSSMSTSRYVIIGGDLLGFLFTTHRHTPDSVRSWIKPASSTVLISSSGRPLHLRRVFLYSRLRPTETIAKQQSPQSCRAP